MPVGHPILWHSVARFTVQCLLLLSLVWMLAACSKAPESDTSADAPSIPGPAKVDKPVDSRPIVLAFGDSLTAGYGVDPEESFPAYLQRRLDLEGYRYRVVNAGISGDTTTGGLARLEEALEAKPAVVILELGGNDGLRGLPVGGTRDNLAQMIELSRDAGAKVILAGITLPPNYGPESIRKFEEMY